MIDITHSHGNSWEINFHHIISERKDTDDVKKGNHAGEKKTSLVIQSNETFSRRPIFCTHIQRRQFKQDSFTDKMQYSHNHFLILFLCLFLVIDQLNATKLRLAPLRVSATFGKTGDCTKKKNCKTQLRGKTIALAVDSKVDIDEL